MIKIIYFIAYFAQKIYNKFFDIFNDWCCKNHVIFDRGNEFKRTAKVENISRNKDNISIGKCLVFRW